MIILVIRLQIHFPAPPPQFLRTTTHIIVMHKR